MDFIAELLSVGHGARAHPDRGARLEIHQRALQRGAMGIVLKGEAASVLIEAIEQVQAGEVRVDRLVMGRVLSRLAGNEEAQQEAFGIASLTNREREVLAKVAEGLKNEQITRTPLRHRDNGPAPSSIHFQQTGRVQSARTARLCLSASPGPAFTPSAVARGCERLRLPAHCRVCHSTGTNVPVAVAGMSQGKSIGSAHAVQYLARYASILPQVAPPSPVVVATTCNVAAPSVAARIARQDSNASCTHLWLVGVKSVALALPTEVVAVSVARRRRALKGRPGAAAGRTADRGVRLLDP